VFLRRRGLLHHERTILPFCRSISSLRRRYFSTENEEDPVAHVDTCWSCNAFKKKRRSFFCVECKLIQPPAKDGPDFFELFSMKPSFDLDVKSLHKTYQQLQLLVHPDKYQTKSSNELEFSEKHSTIISHAYNTLKEPSLRAKYLLQLYGVKLNENDKNVDPEYLMWVLDIQERIAEEPVDELPKILKEVDEEGLKIHKKLSLAFCSQPIQLKEAEILTKKLNFIHRIEQACLDRMPTK